MPVGNLLTGREMDGLGGIGWVRRDRMGWDKMERWCWVLGKYHGMS